MYLTTPFPQTDCTVSPQLSQLLKKLSFFQPIQNALLPHESPLFLLNNHSFVPLISSNVPIYSNSTHKSPFIHELPSNYATTKYQQITPIIDSSDQNSNLNSSSGNKFNQICHLLSKISLFPQKFSTICDHSFMLASISQSISDTHLCTSSLLDDRLRPQNDQFPSQPTSGANGAAFSVFSSHSDISRTSYCPQTISNPHQLALSQHIPSSSSTMLNNSQSRIADIIASSQYPGPSSNILSAVYSIKHDLHKSLANSEHCPVMIKFAWVLVTSHRFIEVSLPLYSPVPFCDIDDHIAASNHHHKISDSKVYDTVAQAHHHPQPHHHPKPQPSSHLSHQNITILLKNLFSTESLVKSCSKSTSILSYNEWNHQSQQQHIRNLSRNSIVVYHPTLTSCDVWIHSPSAVAGGGAQGGGPRQQQAATQPRVHSPTVPAPPPLNKSPHHPSTSRQAHQSSASNASIGRSPADIPIECVSFGSILWLGSVIDVQMSSNIFSAGQFVLHIESMHTDTHTMASTLHSLGSAASTRLIQLHDREVTLHRASQRTEPSLGDGTKLLHNAYSFPSQQDDNAYPTLTSLFGRGCLSTWTHFSSSNQTVFSFLFRALKDNIQARKDRLGHGILFEFLSPQTVRSNFSQQVVISLPNVSSQNQQLPIGYFSQQQDQQSLSEQQQQQQQLDSPGKLLHDLSQSVKMQTGQFVRKLIHHAQTRVNLANQSELLIEQMDSSLSSSSSSPSSSSSSSSSSTSTSTSTAISSDCSAPHIISTPSPDESIPSSLLASLQDEQLSVFLQDLPYPTQSDHLSESFSPQYPPAAGPQPIPSATNPYSSEQLKQTSTLPTNRDDMTINRLLSPAIFSLAAQLCAPLALPTTSIHPQYDNISTKPSLQTFSQQIPWGGLANALHPGNMSTMLQQQRQQQPHMHPDTKDMISLPLLLSPQAICPKNGFFQNFVFPRARPSAQFVSQPTGAAQQRYIHIVTTAFVISSTFEHSRASLTAFQLNVGSIRLCEQLLLAQIYLIIRNIASQSLTNCTLPASKTTQDLSASVGPYSTVPSSSFSFSFNSAASSLPAPPLNLSDMSVEQLQRQIQQSILTMSSANSTGHVSQQQQQQQQMTTMMMFMMLQQQQQQQQQQRQQSQSTKLSAAGYSQGQTLIPVPNSAQTSVKSPYELIPSAFHSDFDQWRACFVPSSSFLHSYLHMMSSDVSEELCWNMQQPRDRSTAISSDHSRASAQSAAGYLTLLPSSSSSSSILSQTFTNNISTVDYSNDSHKKTSRFSFWKSPPTSSHQYTGEALSPDNSLSQTETSSITKKDSAMVVVPMKQRVEQLISTLLVYPTQNTTNKHLLTSSNHHQSSHYLRSHPFELDVPNDISHVISALLLPNGDLDHSIIFPGPDLTTTGRSHRSFQHFASSYATLVPSSVEMFQYPIKDDYTTHFKHNNPYLLSHHDQFFDDMTQQSISISPPENPYDSITDKMSFLSLHHSIPRRQSVMMNVPHSMKVFTRNDQLTGYDQLHQSQHENNDARQYEFQSHYQHHESLPFSHPSIPLLDQQRLAPYRSHPSFSLPTSQIPNLDDQNYTLNHMDQHQHLFNAPSGTIDAAPLAERFSSLQFLLPPPPVSRDLHRVVLYSTQPPLLANQFDRLRNFHDNQKTHTPGIAGYHSHSTSSQHQSTHGHALPHPNAFPMVIFPRGMLCGGGHVAFHESKEQIATDIAHHFNHSINEMIFNVLSIAPQEKMHPPQPQAKSSSSKSSSSPPFPAAHTGSSATSSSPPPLPSSLGLSSSSLSSFPTSSSHSFQKHQSLGSSQSQQTSAPYFISNPLTDPNLCASHADTSSSALRKIGSTMSHTGRPETSHQSSNQYIISTDKPSLSKLTFIPTTFLCSVHLLQPINTSSRTVTVSRYGVSSTTTTTPATTTSTLAPSGTTNSRAIGPEKNLGSSSSASFSQSQSDYVDIFDSINQHDDITSIHKIPTYTAGYAFYTPQNHISSAGYSMIPQAAHHQNHPTYQPSAAGYANHQIPSIYKANNSTNNSITSLNPIARSLPTTSSPATSQTHARPMEYPTVGLHSPPKQDFVPTQPQRQDREDSKTCSQLPSNSPPWKLCLGFQTLPTSGSQLRAVGSTTPNAPLLAKPGSSHGEIQTHGSPGTYQEYQYSVDISAIQCMVHKPELIPILHALFHLSIQTVISLVTAPDTWWQACGVALRRIYENALCHSLFISLRIAEHISQLEHGTLEPLYYEFTTNHWKQVVHFLTSSCKNDVSLSSQAAHALVKDILRYQFPNVALLDPHSAHQPVVRFAWPHSLVCPSTLEYYHIMSKFRIALLKHQHRNNPHSSTTVASHGTEQITNPYNNKNNNNNYDYELSSSLSSSSSSIHPSLYCDDMNTLLQIFHDCQGDLHNLHTIDESNVLLPNGVIDFELSSLLLSSHSQQLLEKTGLTSFQAIASRTAFRIQQYHRKMAQLGIVSNDTSISSPSSLFSQLEQSLKKIANLLPQQDKHAPIASATAAPAAMDGTLAFPEEYNNQMISLWPALYQLFPAEEPLSTSIQPQHVLLLNLSQCLHNAIGPAAQCNVQTSLPFSLQPGRLFDSILSMCMQSYVNENIVHEIEAEYGLRSTGVYSLPQFREMHFLSGPSEQQSLSSSSPPQFGFSNQRLGMPSTLSLPPSLPSSATTVGKAASPVNAPTSPLFNPVPLQEPCNVRYYTPQRYCPHQLAPRQVPSEPSSEPSGRGSAASTSSPPSLPSSSLSHKSPISNPTPSKTIIGSPFRPQSELDCIIEDFFTAMSGGFHCTFGIDGQPLQTSSLQIHPSHSASFQSQRDSYFARSDHSSSLSLSTYHSTQRHQSHLTYWLDELHKQQQHQQQGKSIWMFQRPRPQAAASCFDEEIDQEVQVELLSHPTHQLIGQSKPLASSSEQQKQVITSSSPTFSTKLDPTGTHVLCVMSPTALDTTRESAIYSPAASTLPISSSLFSADEPSTAISTQEISSPSTSSTTTNEDDKPYHEKPHKHSDDDSQLANIMPELANRLSYPCLSPPLCVGHSLDGTEQFHQKQRPLEKALSITTTGNDELTRIDREVADDRKGSDDDGVAAAADDASFSSVSQLQIECSNNTQNHEYHQQQQQYSTSIAPCLELCCTTHQIAIPPSPLPISNTKDTPTEVTYTNQLLLEVSSCQSTQHLSSSCEAHPLSLYPCQLGFRWNFPISLENACFPVILPRQPSNSMINGHQLGNNQPNEVENSTICYPPSGGRKSLPIQDKTSSFLSNTNTSSISHSTTPSTITIDQLSAQERDIFNLGNSNHLLTSSPPPSRFRILSSLQIAFMVPDLDTTMLYHKESPGSVDDSHSAAAGSQPLRQIPATPAHCQSSCGSLLSLVFLNVRLHLDLAKMWTFQRIAIREQASSISNCVENNTTSMLSPFIPVTSSIQENTNNKLHPSQEAFTSHRHSTVSSSPFMEAHGCTAITENIYTTNNCILIDWGDISFSTMLTSTPTSSSQQSSSHILPNNQRIFDAYPHTPHALFLVGYFAQRRHIVERQLMFYKSFNTHRALYLFQLRDQQQQYQHQHQNQLQPVTGTAAVHSPHLSDHSSDDDVMLQLLQTIDQIVSRRPSRPQIMLFSGPTQLQKQSILNIIDHDAMIVGRPAREIASQLGFQTVCDDNQSIEKNDKTSTSEQPVVEESNILPLSSPSTTSATTMHENGCFELTMQYMSFLHQSTVPWKQLFTAFASSQSKDAGHISNDITVEGQLQRTSEGQTRHPNMATTLSTMQANAPYQQRSDGEASRHEKQPQLQRNQQQQQQQSQQSASKSPPSKHTPLLPVNPPPRAISCEILGRVCCQENLTKASAIMYQSLLRTGMLFSPAVDDMRFIWVFPTIPLPVLRNWHAFVSASKSVLPSSSPQQYHLQQHSHLSGYQYNGQFIGSVMISHLSIANAFKSIIIPLLQLPQHYLSPTAASASRHSDGNRFRAWFQTFRPLAPEMLWSRCVSQLESFARVGVHTHFDVLNFVFSLRLMYMPFEQVKNMFYLDQPASIQQCNPKPQSNASTLHKNNNHANGSFLDYLAQKKSHGHTPSATKVVHQSKSSISSCHTPSTQIKSPNNKNIVQSQWNLFLYSICIKSSVNAFALHQHRFHACLDFNSFSQTIGKSLFQWKMAKTEQEQQQQQRQNPNQSQLLLSQLHGLPISLLWDAHILQPSTNFLHVLYYTSSGPLYYSVDSTQNHHQHPSSYISYSNHSTNRPTKSNNHNGINNDQVSIAQSIAPYIDSDFTNASAPYHPVLSSIISHWDSYVSSSYIVFDEFFSILQPAPISNIQPVSPLAVVSSSLYQPDTSTSDIDIALCHVQHPINFELYDWLAKRILYPILLNVLLELR